MTQVIFLYGIGVFFCLVAVWAAMVSGMAFEARDHIAARVTSLTSLAFLAAGMAALVIA